MNINYVTFNQDYSGIGIATNRGFRIYSTEPFMKSYSEHEGDIALMEMLFMTSLVATVPSPRMLRIVNIKRGRTIVELTFPSKILAVRLNRVVVVVVLESNIHIYDITNAKSLHTIDTPPNSNGKLFISPYVRHSNHDKALIALSSHEKTCILAYPCPLQQTSIPSSTIPSHVPPGSQEWHHAASQNVGDVRIFDASTGQALNTIRAHKSSIGCLTLNQEGTLLATASEKGTIIRVFSVPDGNGDEPLFEFRRGSLPAKIYHMSFNATSTLLCVSSATETIHVFKLEKPRRNSTISPPVSPLAPPSHSRTLSSGSKDALNRSTSVSSEDLRESAITDEVPILERKTSGYAANIASRLRQASRDVGMGLAGRVGGYLPQSVTQGLEAQRDFAHVKIPRLHGANGPLRSIVAMSPNHPQLLTVTSEGQFGVYNIDLETGGDGVLEREHSMVESRGTLFDPDD